MAVLDNQRVGLITYAIEDRMLEIVTLNVLKQREGVGRSLIDEAIEEAKNRLCTRIWVITTNDNKSAVKFYQALGFIVKAVHKDAVMESRQLKPEIPLIGIDDIPIRDEIELEKTLSFQ